MLNQPSQPRSSSDVCISLIFSLNKKIMARGHQKFQSQQKNAQKMEKIKKSQGHDQKSAAQKALIFTCTVCKVFTDLYNVFNSIVA